MSTKKWTWTEGHVMPVKDLRSHVMSWGCWCRPKWERWCCVHNSADGREIREQREVLAKEGFDGEHQEADRR